MVRTRQFEDLVSSVSIEIESGIDRAELVRACQQGRYDDRLFFYEDICRRAYSHAFRVHDGSLYWFSGYVWELLNDVLLYNGFRSALVRVASEFYPSIRSDIRGLGKILGRLSPVCCADLGLSNGIVGFRNCVVDFGDVYHPVVHSFSDRMPVLGLLDYDYDESAVCPVWCSFLEQMLSRSQRILLQKFLGMGCVDRSRIGIEKALWLIGSGANGKSTIQGVVMGVFGADRVSQITLSDLLNRRDPDVRMRSMMMLSGKVFNYANEVSEADIMRSADTFKALCSGDKQPVRSLKRNIVMSSMMPYMICNMNKRPEMRNLDKAIVRRLLQIRFRASVSEDDMDLDLSEKLRREYPGIRNWMLEGYKMLARDGFMFGDEDTEGENISVMVENGRTVDAYLYTMGIRDWVHNGQLDEKPKWVKSLLLYDQYKIWCRGHDYEVESVTAFGKLMHSRFVSRRVGSGTAYAVYSDNDLPSVLLV